MYPTLPTFAESRHTAEFLKSEAAGYRSRGNRQILAGSGILKPGTVLGMVLAAAASAVATAGNAGNGTISAVTDRVGVQPGIYLVAFTAPTQFRVVDPDGEEVGTGKTGTAFAGPIGFTITAGATPFAANDGFTITVAPGSGKLKPANPAATDGSAVACAVLYHRIDASAVDVLAAVIERDAEVYGQRLEYDASVTPGAPRTAMLAALAKAGIIAR